MKIFRLLLFFLPLSNSLFAQWELHDCGVSTPKFGVLQLVAVGGNIAWGSMFDVSGADRTTHEFTRTADGGFTWSAGNVTPAASNYVWACLAAVGADTAFALFNDDTAATGGALYRTFDGGLSWSQLTGFSPQSSPHIVYFFTSTDGIVVCDPVNNHFQIFSTTDAGNTWDLVPDNSLPDPLAGETTINASFDARGGKFYFGTNKGRMYDTQNKGQNWDVNQIPGFTTNIDKILAPDNKTLILRQYDKSSGEYTFKRTQDGGSSWDDLNPNGPFYSQNICKVPNTDHTLVSVGWDENIAVGSSYSITSGDGWIPIDTGVAHTSAAFFDNAHGWSGGIVADDSTGGMFRFSGYYFATGITQVTPPSVFTLTPNPASVNFILNSNTVDHETGELKVTDVSGKLIFNKMISISSGEAIDVDVSSWSNGIYFVQYCNNAGNKVEKIVVSH